MAKVFIGVGHGGSDAGACAFGLKEADVNLTMALAMRETLLRHGVSVGISRTRDEDDRLAEEIRECNRFAPDLAVEVHNNAGGGDGFEAYIYPGNAKARQLAQAIEAEVKAIGQNSRGVKTSTTLGWVRQAKAPAVLCEGFFLDSADRCMADTKEKQRRFGECYARGVLRTLGISYRQEEENGMTYSQFQEFMVRYEREREQLPVSGWAASAWKAMTDAGLTDGTAPRAPLTREQYAALQQRAGARTG